MVTKAQESKALAQIKEIINSLGENSYVGMAFEKAIDIADENIRCDFGGSLMDYLESCARDAVQDKIDSIRRDKNDLEAQLSLAEQRGTTLGDENRELQYQNSELVREIATLKDEIIHLKAKLWDFVASEKASDN